MIWTDWPDFVLTNFERLQQVIDAIKKGTPAARRCLSGINAIMY